jgi:hypothetical protein
MLNNKLLTTIVLLIAVSQVYTALSCHTKITDFLAAGVAKEVSDETPLPAVTAMANPTNAGFDENKICG